MQTEAIVYLLRKTNLTRSEIGKLSPSQFYDLIREVSFQESVDEYRRQHSVASLMAAIYNTIPRKRGSKTFTASDFLSGDMPKRNAEVESLDKLAESKGVTLPTKEIKRRDNG